MGYLNKVLHSDVFIWLHGVQYRKNYFQNRTLIKNCDEQSVWLTLPVHARQGMKIDEVTIADPRWRNKVCRTVEQYYRKATFFSDCWPPLAAAMRDSPDSLDLVNYRTFRVLLGLLGGDTVRLERAGKLHAPSEDPTERLVELCIAVGANTYIAGKGGHNYLQTEAFERAGIKVIWQAFDPARVVYPQLGTSFVPGLSVIDCLFNIGPEATACMAREAWKPCF